MPETPNQFYVMAKARDSSKLLQPVSILGISSQRGDRLNANMWLWCPPIDRKHAKPYLKKIDHFSGTKQIWVGMAHEMRNIYRCCTTYFSANIVILKLYFDHLDYAASLLARATIMAGRWAIQAFWVFLPTTWQG